MCSVAHRIFHTINHNTMGENQAYPVKDRVRLMYIPACTGRDEVLVFWIEKTHLSKLAHQIETPDGGSKLFKKTCFAAFSLTAESFCLVVKWPDADQSGMDIKAEQRNKPKACCETCSPRHSRQFNAPVCGNNHFWFNQQTWPVRLWLKVFEVKWRQYLGARLAGFIKPQGRGAARASCHLHTRLTGE